MAKKITTEPIVETPVIPTTITLPNRSALWSDCSIASGYEDYIPAGTHHVAEVKDGFTLIEGKGWVHCTPN